MQNPIDSSYLGIRDGEINFQEILQALFKGKWIIFSITSFVSILAVIYSIYLPDIYQSRSTLHPVQDGDGISSALSSYSGLAGFAGIDLSQSGDNKTTRAILKINSLSFFKNNIMPNIFLPNLMAVKSWNSETNSISFDENIYDSESKEWVKDASIFKGNKPSIQDSFFKFTSEHLSIIQDKKTGIITVSIKHHSPYIAKEWAELVIDQVNLFYREKEKLQAERAISYLNDQMLKTNFSEIKQAISQLIKQETQKLMLIEANKYFVFDYIDPPAVMERRIEPRRSIICILGAILGFILGLLFVLINHYRSNVKH